MAVGTAKASAALAASYILSWGLFLVLVSILSLYMSKVRAVFAGYISSYVVYGAGIYAAGWIMKEEFSATQPIKEESQDEIEFEVKAVSFKIEQCEEEVKGNSEHDLTARRSGAMVEPPVLEVEDVSIAVPSPQPPDSHLPPPSPEPEGDNK